MKKKFLKRAAAFAVASLMAVGVITVLPDECLPQIGSVVSAEEVEVGGVAINAVNFPDEIFRQYVSENFDTDGDSVLSSSEISSATYININDKGVQNLKGVEYFTSLTFLECKKNQLTSFDISNNTELTTLWCDKNQLTSLDISNNTELIHLTCADNQLTSLNLSNNIALKWLSCNDNQLTSLDVSNNTALTGDFWCFNNQLMSLDIGKNTVLTGLNCGNNQLTSLDVSNNTTLKELYCCGNQLTSLDVSNDTELTILHCYKNQLTSLDVSTNTALTDLRCDENKLTSLDVSNNTELTNFVCHDNQLTSLDIGNNPLVTEFGCNRNLYNIGETCGTYELKNLPTGFDLTKASNWQGATLKDDMLTEIKGTVSYDYDCGNGKTATFTLTYDYIDHSYDDGVITTDPTEEAEGEKTYTCTVCGATKTEVIAKLDHVHNKGDEIVSDETGHWYTCSGCDEKLDFSTHTEDSGMVTVEPTETTEGEKIYKCTVCGHTTRTDVIAKLEHVHNQGTELISDATGHWYTCSVCDEKLDFATHTEDSGTVTVEPTEAAEGEKVYKCTVCGYTTRTETIAKLGGGSNNPTGPSRPSQPSEPSKPTQPSNPSQLQQPETNGSETNISVKKGWGNVVKEINKANDNSKINVDMGNSTNVPKNVMNAIKGKNVDIVLDMGDGITWTINGKDVTDPQSIDFSVTKKKNQIPDDMISDPSNTIPLVLAHNGNFGCSATLSIDLKDNDNKIANLYYYNTKTKELEFVDSSVIVNGKASLVFTHASDWAIVISDTSAEYEDVSSAAGAYETDDNSQAPLCIIIIILAALGFSHIIIMKRLTKHKR